MRSGLGRHALASARLVVSSTGAASSGALDMKPHPSVTQQVRFNRFQKQLPQRVGKLRRGSAPDPGTRVHGKDDEALFTSKKFYNSKKFNDFTKSTAQQNAVREGHAQLKKERSYGVGPVARRQLDSGAPTQNSPRLRDAAKKDSEAELALGSSVRADRRSAIDNDARAAVRKQHAIQNREDLNRTMVQYRNVTVEPNSRQYMKLQNHVSSEGQNEAVAAARRAELEEKHGVYAEQRLDAYMLGDEACFPEWVHALNPVLRDRVKYGAVGLTEEDEATKAILQKMPVDERLREWTRMKKGRQYMLSLERKITPRERRALAMGVRQHKRLLQQRIQRTTRLRRMALRKPEQHTVFPSHHIDYSNRMALVAKHVENGVATNGQWPLFKEDTDKAERLRERAEMTGSDFVSLSAPGTASMDPSMKESIHKVKMREESDIQRVSRKQYKNRVNAVMHGHMDEYGRSLLKMPVGAFHRQDPLKSAGEFAFEKENDNLPRQHRQRANNTEEARRWPDSYRKSSKRLYTGTPNFKNIH